MTRNVVHLAVAFALGGSLLAVLVPTVIREVHTSMFAEPMEALGQLSQLEGAYIATHGGVSPPAPLTPAVPPRGHKEVDPEGAWETPAWTAVGFRMPAGVPRYFAYALDTSDLVAFRAVARADVDGDGVMSTLEVRGDLEAPGRVRIRPGVYMENELE
jgi:hypothetical protein